MSLANFFRPGRSGLSFELFPPKSAAGLQSLLETVGELNEFQPDFFTCTYGAGGSTRDATLDIITEVKRRYNKPVATHLTCVGSTVEQLRDYLTEARARGVDYVVALRGDPPKGESEFKAVVGGLLYAN
jgi:methylenetetrahydrofolate reductase (NADPH)